MNPPDEGISIFAIDRDYIPVDILCVVEVKDRQNRDDGRPDSGVSRMPANTNTA
jgi:hypothetical protein